MDTTRESQPNSVQRYFLEKQAGLMASCRAILGIGNELLSDEDDVKQIVLMKLSDFPDTKWEGIRAKKTYMFRIIVNTWLDLLRRKKEFATDDDVLAPLYEKHLLKNQPYQNPETSIAVHIFLSRFADQSPEKDQRLLEMLVEGAPNDEIGRNLGVNSGTARKRVSRLRETLRQQFYDSDENPP